MVIFIEEFYGAIRYKKEKTGSAVDIFGREV
jgi:hypothetical protein